MSDGRKIFLFANPASGGSGAAAFIDAGIQHLVLSIPEHVHIWIFDIREGDTGNKPGFIQLKEAIKEEDALVYVIVCGGDGTVMWGISELWAHGIDDSRIALGVVPYGTGNDFARALGWNAFNALHPFANNFKVFKEILKEWLSAQVVFHDIWNITLKVKSDGSFQKIDSSTRLKKAVAGVRPILNGRQLSRSISAYVTDSQQILCNMSARVLTLKMCNYFSLGIESRIGVGFDRYRTRSQFLNKLRYAIEGGKKAMFKNIPPLNNSIHRLTDDGKPVFDNTGTSAPPLKNGTRSLIASNIHSFAAGLDLWTPASNIGIKVNNTTPKVILTDKQQAGDGKLEFLGFTGVTALGLERAFHGRGRRVISGTGPFVIDFVQEGDKRNYFQVDGEFFIMTRPESVTISHDRQIKVLCRAELAEKQPHRFIFWHSS